MLKCIRSFLSQLVVFLTIVSFLSLEASVLYASEVFSQRYGIIEHEQSTNVNSEDMDLTFVIPDAGGPVYHPLASYPIGLLIEQREELNSLVTGFKEAGQDIPEIVSFLKDSNSLQDIVVSLCRNGFDIVDIAFTLGSMGYSKEEVKSVLPVRIDSWGQKKSIMVGITSVGSSAFYYSTANPLPVTKASLKSTSKLSNSKQPNTKRVFKTGKDIPKENRGPANQGKPSCSDALKRLQSDGRVDLNTAVLLLEAGYTVSEIVFAYVDMALDWAGDKTIEFVNCAAYALAETLGVNIQQRPDIDIENLATEIIYRDILMQGEVWIKEGKIQSSMAAIQQTASIHGIELNAYQVDTDEFFPSQIEPAIIHLKQGHWVVLKKVYENGMATVISDGKKVQMSVASLKEMFSGNVLSAENIENATILKKAETQQIRGSGWGKKFKKWRKKMGKKIKSFLKSKIGRIITMIVVVILTVFTAGAFGAAFLSGWGAMGTAIAAGVGTFVSTFAVCTASGMKLKDSLKTAVIAGVIAGVTAYFGGSGKEVANKVVKETVKEAVKETAKKQITAYATQEILAAAGNSNPYANVLASALSGGVNAAINGGNIVDTVVRSAAAQGLNETSSANEWNAQVSKLAGTAVNSAVDDVLDEKKSSLTEIFTNSVKTTVDSVKDYVKKKVDAVKNGVDKVYEVTNQGIEFFKKTGEKTVGYVKEGSKKAAEITMQGAEFFKQTITSTIESGKIGYKNLIGAVNSVEDSLYRQVEEFSGGRTLLPRVEITSKKSILFDQELNFFNYKKGIILTGDAITSGQVGRNVRWTGSNEFTGKAYEKVVRKIKILNKKLGLSISGVNDNGVNLDKLVQALTDETDCSFTITHSAGSGALLESNIATEKVMLISPQVSRAELEAWIEKIGLEKHEVIIVDVKGDLPQAPKAADMLGAVVENNRDVLGTVASIIDNTAYNDLSKNPNNKYTYVRIEEGEDLSSWNMFNNHSVGIDAFFDENGNINIDNKFNIRINGNLNENVSLFEVYKKLLKGESLGN